MSMVNSPSEDVTDIDKRPKSFKPVSTRTCDEFILGNAGDLDDFCPNRVIKSEEENHEIITGDGDSNTHLRNIVSEYETDDLKDIKNIKQECELDYEDDLQDIKNIKQECELDYEDDLQDIDDKNIVKCPIAEQPNQHGIQHLQENISIKETLTSVTTEDDVDITDDNDTHMDNVDITDDNNYTHMDNVDVTDDNYTHMDDDDPEISEHSDHSKVPAPPEDSYCTMITKAILSTPDKCISHQKLFEFISQNYPSYSGLPDGWQTSIKKYMYGNTNFIRVLPNASKEDSSEFWILNPVKTNEKIQSSSRDRKVFQKKATCPKCNKRVCRSNKARHLKLCGRKKRPTETQSSCPLCGILITLSNFKCHLTKMHLLTTPPTINTSLD